MQEGIRTRYGRNGPPDVAARRVRPNLLFRKLQQPSAFGFRVGEQRRHTDAECSPEMPSTTGAIGIGSNWDLPRSVPLRIRRAR